MIMSILATVMPVVAGIVVVASFVLIHKMHRD